MNEEIARAENEQGLGSLIGQIADYAFNEVAKYPGYLAATNKMLTPSAPVSTVNLDSLLAGILESKKNLVHLEGMISLAEPSPRFVGVIPSIYATAWLQGSREGVISAITFLDHLVTTLQTISEFYAKSQCSGSVVRPDSTHDDHALHFPPTQRALGGPATQAPVIKHPEDIDLDSYAIGDRMDRFSLTMGMGSLLPAACGFPPFSAYDAISGLPTKLPAK
jgi:hypothetical protein